MVRGSLGLAAAGAALARPNTANAAATTVETWSKERFFPEKDVAFRALVAVTRGRAATKSITPSSQTLPPA
jgi:hypothetical protein